MSEHADDAMMRSLLRLARDVTARHDLDDVLSETFRELRATVEFGGGSIQLIDDDGWITVAASDPPSPQDALSSRVPLGNSVAGRVVLTEQAVYVADVVADGREVLLPTPEWSASVRSYVAVPLLADGRAIGLLRIDATTVDAFSPSDRQFLVSAGVVVAAAIQNARSHARTATTRVRVESLEARNAEIHRMIADARSMGLTTDGDVAGLLNQIELSLGDPSSIEMPDGRQVTL